MVKVRTKRVKAGGVLAVDEHKDGFQIRVNDGHLFVIAASAPIAAYAPGEWSDAVVEANSQ